MSLPLEVKKAVQKRICTSCKEPIMAFREENSFKEYMISGLCQKCQDEIWPLPETSKRCFSKMTIGGAA